MALPPTPAACAPALQLLPGAVLTLFVVRVDGAGALFAVPVARLLEGLRTARALLGFEGLQRDDDEQARLDELLPWAGNV